MKYFSFLLLLVVLIACGDDDVVMDANVADRSIPDARVRVDATIPDADLPLEGTDCTENYNADCEATEVCDCADRNDGKCACITGERGTVPVGSECEGDDNKVCESGACLNGICTQICNAPEDCTVLPFNYCHPVLGLCALQPEE